MSKGSRFVFDAKTGKFVEGKAAPWLPPEHMRGLPGEFVTKDTSDGDKIHELDPPHIVKALIHDQTKALEAKRSDLGGALKSLNAAQAPLGERVPLNQLRIDIVRFRTIRARITRLAQSPEPEVELRKLKVDYVFFPENNVNKAEIRKKPGGPGRYQPLPQPLPRHLRGFKLELDIYNWPESIVDALKQVGQKPPDVRQLIADAKRRSSITQELRGEDSVIWTPG